MSVQSVSAKEIERLAELHRYEILDTPPEPAFDRIVSIAAALFDVPIALISLVDRDRIWFKARHGWDAQQAARDPGMCAAAIGSDGVYVVSDTLKDSRVREHPLVTGSAGIRFYCAAPLRTRSGHNLGTLCILDTKPRQMSGPQQEALQNLAAMVVDEMDLRLARRKLEREAVDEALVQERKLFMAGPTVVFKWKAAEGWPVEYVSPNVSQFGFTPEDFMSGKVPYAQIVHPEDLERVAEEVKSFSAAGVPCFEQEYRVIGGDGQVRWLYDFTVVVCDTENRITHYHGYVQDITVRKRAEEAQRESVAKYEAVSDAFDGLIYICSADFKVEFMNKRLLERTGHDAVGEPCYTALHDRDSICPWCVNESVMQGKTVRWEVLSPKDNRWYYIVNTPIRHPDGTMSKMAMIQDITDRKLADDKLRHREAILEAVGYASEQFMKKGAWEQSIQEVLARLGQATGVSRVYMVENHAGREGDLLASRRYEWVAPGISSQMYNPALQDLPLRARGFQRWEESLSRGRVIDGHVREFAESERTLLASLGIRSIVAVPIFAEQNWWGFIGFDSCLNEREWSPVEIDALKTAASLLGAAIQRRRAEEALEASEERNRVVLNAIPDLIFRMGKDGTFLDFKAERESDLAVPPNQIIGRKIEDLLPHEVASQAMYHIRRALSTGERQIYEYELAVGGRPHHYEARMVVSGKDEVLAIVRNVTERRKAEEEVRESERRLADIINFLPDPTFVIDREGRIIAWNRAIEALSGHKAENMLGKNNFEHALPFYGERRPILADLVLKPDAEAEKQYKYIERAKDTLIAEFFLPSLRPGGVYVWAIATPLYDSHGHVVGAIESIRDMTERAQAAEAIKKLAAFPQFNPNAVLEFTADGTLSYFNKAAKEMAASLGKGDPGEILPPGTDAIVKECLESGESRVRMEVTLGKRTLTWSFYPVIETRTVHAYGADVTDRLNLESQMRHLQKMEAVGRLAGGVAHDFNNILTAILGYSSMLLLEERLPGHVVEQLREIAKAADRASHLTRQLLTFSRKHIIQPKVLKLGEVLHGLGNMLRQLIGEDITLEMSSEPKLPPIHADQSMLEQVLVNLVINARDAMPRGGRITIRAEAVDIDKFYARDNPEARSGRYVRLSVADTGCGLSKEMHAHLFEPFFTTKESGQGTGLGLATVYGIVKQHDGWIEVISEENRGATFSVFLPVYLKPARQEVRSEKTVVKGGTETVLVVEDEPTVRSLACSVLGQFGYKVFEASSGGEGLDIWKAQGGRIDLLLADVVMPGGITGSEMAEKLWEKNKDLKVLLTSGYNLDTLLQRFSLRKGVAFLPKPFSPEDLARRVRECLDA